MATLNSLEKLFKSLERIVKGLASDMGSVKTDLTMVKADMTMMKMDLTMVKRDMVRKDETMGKNELLTHFDTLYGTQGNIKQELVFINKGLKNVEKDVVELKTTTNRIEQKLDKHLCLPVELAHAR